jgi:hypothetical protein
MVLVVMPEECQSMPMTAPKDWNQKGAVGAAATHRDRSGGRSPADDGTQLRHALLEPCRNASAAEWEIGSARALGHRLFGRFTFDLHQG